MATNSKAILPRGRFTSFINSPRFGKFFKLLLVFLILGAAVYGGYTLIGERFSSAANGTYWQSSKGIGHQIGEPAIGVDGKTVVWKASYNGNMNYMAWYGPYRDLPGKRQYMGCFEYANGGDVTRPPGAFFEVTADWGKTILRSEKATAKFQPGKSTGYDRLCLPFYLKGPTKDVELKVRPFYGTMLIRNTEIKYLTSKKSNGMFRQYDDSSILTGYGYK